jgi:hypothetical protein
MQMATFDDSHASLLQAIERIEAALILIDDTSFPTSAFLIERALHRMRADAWPDAIDDAPAAHLDKKSESQLRPLNQNVSSARHHHLPELVLRTGIVV